MDHLSFVYLMAPDGAFPTRFDRGTGAGAMAKRIREYL